MPQIEGLTVDDFLTYARGKAQIQKYLPDERGWNHVDKKWVCDMIYTLDAPGFESMMGAALRNRKERLDQSQG